MAGRVAVPCRWAQGGLGPGHSPCVVAQQGQKGWRSFCVSPRGDTRCVRSQDARVSLVLVGTS